MASSSNKEDYSTNKTLFVGHKLKNLLGNSMKKNNNSNFNSSSNSNKIEKNIMSLNSRKQQINGIFQFSYAQNNNNNTKMNTNNTMNLNDATTTSAQSNQYIHPCLQNNNNNNNSKSKNNTNNIIQSQNNTTYHYSNCNNTLNTNKYTENDHFVDKSSQNLQPNIIHNNQTTNNIHFQHHLFPNSPTISKSQKPDIHMISKSQQPYQNIISTSNGLSIQLNGLFIISQIISVNQWKSIINLQLSNSELRVIPYEIWDMPQIISLKLNDNYIGSIDDWLFNRLNLLQELDLSNNLVKSIPRSITQSKNLKHIILSKNHLNLIEKSIFQLPKLSYLDVSSNHFTILPAEIVYAKRLNRITLDWFRYLNPPLEITQQSEVISKIQEYIQKQQQQYYQSNSPTVDLTIDDNTSSPFDISFQVFLDIFSQHPIDLQRQLSNQSKGSLIHLAVFNGDLGALKGIIEFQININSPSIINQLDVHYHSPLSLAIEEGQYIAADMLLNLGADVNIGGKYAYKNEKKNICNINEKNQDTLINTLNSQLICVSSCLFLAIIRLQSELVQELLNREADLNFRDGSGNSCIHHLFQVYDKSPLEGQRIGQMLLQKMTNEHNNARNKDNMTALHLAAQKGYIGPINFAFEFNKKRNKMQIIHNKEVIKYSNIAEPFEMYSYGCADGMDMLMIACANCQVEVVELLVLKWKYDFTRRSKIGYFTASMLGQRHYSISKLLKKAEIDWVNNGLQLKEEIIIAATQDMSEEIEEQGYSDSNKKVRAAMYQFKVPTRDRNQGNNTQFIGNKIIRFVKGSQMDIMPKEDLNEEQLSEPGSEELTEDSEIFEEGKGNNRTTAAGFLGEERHIRLIKECKGQDGRNEGQEGNRESSKNRDIMKNEGFYEENQENEDEYQDILMENEKNQSDCVNEDEYDLDVRKKMDLQVRSYDNFQPLKGQELQEISMEIQRMFEYKRKMQEKIYEQQQQQCQNKNMNIICNSKNHYKRELSSQMKQPQMCQYPQHPNQHKRQNRSEYDISKFSPFHYVPSIISQQNQSNILKTTSKQFQLSEIFNPKINSSKYQVISISKQIYSTCKNNYLENDISQEKRYQTVTELNTINNRYFGQLQDQKNNTQDNLLMYFEEVMGILIEKMYCSCEQRFNNHSSIRGVPEEYDKLYQPQAMFSQYSQINIKDIAKRRNNNMNTSQ